LKKEFIIERQGKSFVLYAGLLEEAHAQGLKEVSTALLQVPTPDNGNMAVCSAVVETERGRFTGIGDASPGNVSKMILPHLIRMAETRAKARALRDAVNVGITAIEELGGDDDPAPVFRAETVGAGSHRRNDSFDSGPAFEHFSSAEPAGAPRPMGINGRSATEKQIKAIYAIANTAGILSKSDVDAKTQEMYGHSPTEMSVYEASQFIDLLKQDKVA